MPMPNADVLRVLSGISSVLGLLSCLAYFFVLLLSKRAERSIRTTIDNTEPLLKADHIIRIIAKFKTDETRLIALERLLDWDRRTAEAFLSKVKGDVNVLELVSLERRYDLSWLFMVGLFFLVIGVFGLLALHKAPAQSGSAPSGGGPSAATTDSSASSLEDRGSATTDATTDFVGNTDSSASSSEDENSPSVSDGLVIFEGNATKIRRVSDGAGKQIINPNFWLRGVQYIRVEGCGGGGGGSGAGRARSNQGDYNQGPSGAGGAGSEWVTYTYQIPANRRVPIEFQSDSRGGCGGVTDHTTCAAAPATKYAPNEGESGHKGVTVVFGGSFSFEGGEPGRVVPGWDWSKGYPPTQAPGGQHFTPGGNGGTHNIGMPTAGGETQDHPGGMVGGAFSGSGGFAGAGGGASLKGKGGDGGTAGSGSTNYPANDAKSGHPGEYCAGGGGGGSAAGGDFPGGN